MGDVAEMMLDGTLCGGCGAFLDGKSPGYVRYCSRSCGPISLDRALKTSVSPRARRAERNDRDRHEAAKASKPFKCEKCSRLFRTMRGREQHTHDTHNSQARPA